MKLYYRKIIKLYTPPVESIPSALKLKKTLYIVNYTTSQSCTPVSTVWNFTYEQLRTRLQQHL